MKYLTIAVLLGVVSADALENALNALKITVKDGDRIEKEWNDVEHTAKRIHNSRPARNLRSSLKRWGHSKEMHQLEQLDKKFMRSPAGKKLMAEWKDVGDALEQHVYHNKSGLHIDNTDMHDVEDELRDVEDQYEHLSKTHWAKKYQHARHEVFNNEEFHALHRRAQSFKKSAPGKALKKEVLDFKRAIKEEVKVTDIPERWQKGEEALKIEISPEGQRIIEKEANDVGETMDKIEHSRAVRNMESSLDRWGNSEEVKALQELDKKFMASPEGQRLMQEWQDFGEVMKKHIKETEHGIHIDNDAWDEIEDEAKDIEHQYDNLEGSEWDKAYTAGWNAATTNDEAKGVERRWNRFTKSEEWGMLAKELVELDEALKKNVKVTDIPEEWKEGQQNLKIHVNDAGIQDIEDEWNDVEETWDKIEHSRPVRNLEGSLERWGQSAEVQHIHELDKKFYKSEEGQRLIAEWSDVFEAFDEVVYHNENGMHISNEDMPHLEDEINDVKHQYDELEGSEWDKAYTAGYNAAFSNKEFGSVARRAERFKKSEEGQALKREMHDVKMAIKKNVEVTDIPEEWKKDMFLF